MLFNININQKAVIEHFEKLDLTDMAIFCCLKNMIVSKYISKKIINKMIYSWISYSAIIKELPILNIDNKETIARHVNKLVVAGLIGREYGQDNNTYFKLEKACDFLEFDSAISSKEGVSTQNKKAQIEGGIDSKQERGIDSKQERGVSTQNKNNHNTINTDHNTINHNTINTNTPPTSINPKPNLKPEEQKPVPTIDWDSEAKFFLEQVQVNNSEANTVTDNDLKRWAEVIKRMVQKDKKKRSIEDIRTLICLCRDDPFWSTNIRSPATMREKWNDGKISIQKLSGNLPANKGKVNWSVQTDSKWKAKAIGLPLASNLRTAS